MLLVLIGFCSSTRSRQGCEKNLSFISRDNKFWHYYLCVRWQGCVFRFVMWQRPLGEAHWKRVLPGKWPSQQSSKSPTWKIKNAKNNNDKKETIQVILLASMLHHSKMVTLAPEDRQTIANFCSGLATLQEEPRNRHDSATINVPYFSFK